jgi:hypothetical protein
VLEIITIIIKLIEGLHGLKWLIDAARADPRSTIALTVLLLAGAVFAIVIRYTRRSDFPTIR